MQRLARIALVTLLFAAPAAAEISALGPQSTAVAADGRVSAAVEGALSTQTFRTEGAAVDLAHQTVGGEMAYSVVTATSSPFEN